MRHKWGRFGDWAARILCSLALLFVGLAHQPPAFAGEPGIVHSLRLPDGSIPAICNALSDDHAKGKSDHRLHGQGCEACRISATAFLPTPTEIGGYPAVHRRPIALPRWPEPFRRQIYPPNNGPRAPPFFPILT